MSPVIFDIIFSIVVAGAVMLMVINMNQTVANETFVSVNELSIQTNMTTLVRIIENDFRKIGYCKDPNMIPDPEAAIKEVSSTSIKFLSDVESPFGQIDTVKYWIGDTSTCNMTPNPRDKMLFRKISTSSTSKTDRYVLGLLKFDLTYYNTWGDRITIPPAQVGEISTLQLSVLLESPYAYDTVYSYSYWRQIRLAARNLKNR
ncbi:MAG: hypothetical protein HY964_09965 [Ignavibacteriales bacterium]|nr:hypothetical protein [Ignavibacteriales bacterium]